MVPFKWHVADASGNPVANLTSVTVTAVSLSCPLGTTEDHLEEYAADGSGLQNLGNGDYQFNWAAPKATKCEKSCWKLTQGF